MAVVIECIKEQNVRGLGGQNFIGDIFMLAMPFSCLRYWIHICCCDFSLPFSFQDSEFTIVANLSEILSSQYKENVMLVSGLKLNNGKYAVLFSKKCLLARQHLLKITKMSKTIPSTAT